ncbi:MAG: HD domain-containing protein [Methanomicrobiaceae archaeon]|nr:HD domain-containing protein [Methanomicrobiaceae archaeon]
MATRDEITTYIREKEALLSPDAARNDDAVRRHNRTPDDIRTRFSRDADRIIHSRAYARYIDKTQVFYLVDNDHITHRVLHVQLVSKIARTIGRSLRLNEDLVEAIALGHDIGHIPYGHTGEACLSAICAHEGIGAFRHNVQSIRFLDDIEDCDLTLQVLDGILCHNGEGNDHRLVPDPCGDWAAFDARVAAVQDSGDDPAPMTLEGCVVRFADSIAYIGRDIQDAREVNLIGEEEPLPPAAAEVLGSTTREIVHALIMNVIANSDPSGESCIAYDDEHAAALDALKEFNYRRIYENSQLTTETEKIRRMYETVFTDCVENVRAERRSAPVYRDFIDTPWICPGYVESAAPEELARDFIAGMTDRYFETRFRDLMLPRRISERFPPEK